MNYLILENNIITNIIVADQEFANSINALPYYEGAIIGQEYNPPFDLRESYIGTGTNKVIIYYESVPNMIIITPENNSSQSFMFVFGSESNNINLDWNRNYVSIESNELNKNGVKYYFMIM